MFEQGERPWCHLLHDAAASGEQERATAVPPARAAPPPECTNGSYSDLMPPHHTPRYCGSDDRPTEFVVNGTGCTAE